MGKTAAIASGMDGETAVMLAKIADIACGLSRSELLVLAAVVKEFVKREKIGQERKNARLTGRESEVLILVANGYSRRAIGKSLGISAHTAARHIANIYSKLGVSSVAEATQWAFTNGLISVPHCERNPFAVR